MSGYEIFKKNFLPLWRDFLNTWYHYLTRIIRPRFFYSYLRGEGVFTIDDEELVEKTYVTTAMKAGCLIDTIATKGEKGFIAFMEVIEYTYPDLFSILTNLKPRLPPHTYPSERGSITDRLLECLSSLQESLQQKRENLEQMQHIINFTKTEFDGEVKHMSCQIETLTKENDKLKGELASLRKFKELHSESLGKIDSERQENNELRKRIETMSIKEIESIKMANNETLNKRVISLEDDITRWKNDRKKLETIIEQLKAERDKFKMLSDEQEQKYACELEIKKRLEAECETFLKKYNEVVDIARKLETKIMDQELQKDEQILRIGKLSQPTKDKGIRNAAVFSDVPPLLVYPPQSIKREVSETIAKQFGRIPTDLIKSSTEMAELINIMEVLDYETTDIGYSCIRNSQLKQMEKTTLLEMPVTFVSYLSKANVWPIIIVIKFKGDKSLSDDEKYLKKEGFHYNTIEVEEKLNNNDKKSVVDSILSKVKSIVENFPKLIVTRIDQSDRHKHLDENSGNFGSVISFFVLLMITNCVTELLRFPSRELHKLIGALKNYETTRGPAFEFNI